MTIACVTMIFLINAIINAAKTIHIGATAIHEIGSSRVIISSINTDPRGFPVFFEPLVYSLGGCRPIQARLRARRCERWLLFIKSSGALLTYLPSMKAIYLRSSISKKELMLMLCSFALFFECTLYQWDGFLCQVQYTKKLFRLKLMYIPVLRE